MLIGLSFSRCLKDLMTGEMPIERVLVIIASTNFDPRKDDEWAGIWDHYSNNAWWNVDHTKTEQDWRELTLKLYNTGKIHQPRQFGVWLPQRGEVWLETALPASELEKNPAAKAAWEKFQTVAGLTNVEIDINYQ